MPRRAALRAVALGVSSGGLEALKRLLGALPAHFPVPILVVQHLSPDGESALAGLLDAVCGLRVKEADPDEAPRPGTVYLAPPNYHLQVEPDGRLSLSTDPPVNFARPSVDVLFETAALAYGPALAGVILTGAGTDGSAGLAAIRDHGGTTLVQDPADALCPAMPQAALAAVQADHVAGLDALAPILVRLAASGHRAARARESHAD
jgi:two-component system chemotaxis response regulator CheB